MVKLWTFDSEFGKKYAPASNAGSVKEIPWEKEDPTKYTK